MKKLFGGDERPESKRERERERERERGEGRTSRLLQFRHDEFKF